MGDKTGIEWTDATWNPIRGCSRVSEGCRNCYAETVANRFKGEGQPYAGLIAKGGQWNGSIKFVPEMLDQPLRWRKPRRIFVNSMSDLFHENVPDEVIDKVFAVMALARQHTFQILTKRPERMRDYMNSDALIERNSVVIGARNSMILWPHVWLGVSVEDQKALDERLPLLLDTPAAVRWISAEPLLGPVDLSCWPIYGPDREQMLNWVVVGGESGPHARPMHPEWARSLRDQCAAAGVPFLFKQWGEWAPTANAYETDPWRDLLPDGTDYTYQRIDEFETAVRVRRVGKKAAGRLLDGVQHDGYPEGR